MKKANLYLLASIPVLAGITFTAIQNLKDSSGFSFYSTQADQYLLSFDKNTSIGSEEEFIVTSSENNHFDFMQNGLSSLANHFGTLAKDGCIFNKYDTEKLHRNALGSMNSITIVFDGDLKIDYSWGGEVSSSTYIRKDFPLTSGSAFTFNGEHPNYFRIVANENTTITSIDVSYACGTNDVYPSGYKSIKSENELKAFRDSVNSGDNHSGVVVYVTEDFSLSDEDFGNPIGNTDSITFSGIFDGLGHTISGLKKTTGNALGLFSRVTKGTVKNLKLANVSITGNGQRASALVARAVDATIVNCEIVSGSISGTTQNGGIVGVVVAGTSKTIIDRCINRANVSGTTGGGNGGIVGYAHSGVAEIKNCINFGNVTSTGTNTTGGILGSAAPASETTINHCYNSPDAEIKNGSTTASANYASKVGLIHSGASALGSDYGNYNTVINNASDFRTFLANGTVMSGEKVILSQDIDFNDVTNNDGTDYSRSTSFKGIFDGLGHTINNFKSKATTAALFKDVITGTVMNFKMKNVQVQATTQRAASVASRFEKSTLKDVEVISGAISGVQENGGLLGVLVNTDNIVENCINNASITATGQRNGGIVGFSATATTSVELMNCINRGTITGGAITTGGIIGATASNGTGLINIHDNANYGDVYGTSYVGGIIGLARENSNNGSIINNCSNYGNIIGSSNVSSGGIAGLNRFNVEDCVCYSNSHISLNSVDSLASELSAVGGVVSGTAGGGEHRGYISGTTGNNAIAAGTLNDERMSSFVNTIANGNTTINQAYGRIQKLTNGKTILTMANRFSISSKEGVGNYETLVNRDTAVNKGGFGLDYVPGYSDENHKLWLANMEPLVLPDGRLFIFYRTDCKEVTSGVYYSSIRAIESRDNGQTWLDTRHIIFENYATDSYGDGTIRGAYEPFAIMDENGMLQIFIAFDAGSTRAGGLGPDNSAFTCINYNQNLLRIPVDISNMGFNVGETAMAIRGQVGYPRPGMPSVVKLTDGSYAMILEHNGTADYSMRVAISYSHDLITWTAPRIIIEPSHTGVAFDSLTYICGAPYIQLLPDGRIAVSYTTNDFFTCDDLVRNVCDKNYFKTVELAISDGPVTYNSTPNMERKSTVDYAINSGARFGGCAFIDNKLILIANEYEMTATETYDEEKGEYIYSNSRVVKRGTVFSTAVYYC